MTEINVNKIWFDHIKTGDKTIEGRLNKGKFKTFKKDEIIYFKNDQNKIKIKIINIIEYKDFKTYLEQEGLKRTLPGIDSIKNGVKVYRSFYPKEMEDEFGVLAIEIKLIP